MVQLMEMELIDAVRKVQSDLTDSVTIDADPDMLMQSGSTDRVFDAERVEGSDGIGAGRDDGFSGIGAE